MIEVVSHVLQKEDFEISVARANFVCLNLLSSFREKHLPSCPLALEFGDEYIAVGTEKKRRDRIGREEMKWTLSSRKKRTELKEGNEAEVKGPGQIKIDLHKLIPKCDSKFDDISLFLISFERQAKILNLPKICWVTHLISILPSEIVGLIAREPEKDAADYEFVKKLLLQRSN
ncbi:uncharacterized protein TNCV_426311 [Trichonephila clavipes]|nr:uncharacterized protein TNCV_426311 [Trichonephila clavipes]